jgi:hypothetical protein
LIEKLSGAPIEFHCNMRATIKVRVHLALEANRESRNAVAAVADFE